MAQRAIRRKPVATRIAPKAKPTLLGLPPELRNRIYRATLLEEDDIVVEEPNTTQPGLLRTCRQIQREASEMFYRENTFVTMVRDLRLWMPPDHWTLIHVPAGKRKLGMAGVMNWENLKAWLKSFRDGRTIGFTVGEQCADCFRIVGEAFAIVRALFDLEWETIEEVLESYRKGTALAQTPWV